MRNLLLVNKQFLKSPQILIDARIFSKVLRTRENRFLIIALASEKMCTVRLLAKTTSVHFANIDNLFYVIVLTTDSTI